jgi:hypothetical protein
MRMKPMLFSTPMVEAILNTKPDIWPAEPVDRAKPFKWQTRRVIKPQPAWTDGRYRYDGLQNGVPAVELLDDDYEPTEQYFGCPKPLCEEGDIIWVRETWSDFFRDSEKSRFIYRADEERVSDDFRWNPSIHMPREAARLFLEVKSVRVERLQDIKYELGGFEAEGVSNSGYRVPTDEVLGERKLFERIEPYRFRGLWDALAKKSRSPHTWEGNPWVFVYEFMPTKKNKEKEIKND